MHARKDIISRNERAICSILIQLCFRVLVLQYDNTITIIIEMQIQTRNIAIDATPLDPSHLSMADSYE